jgi:uncharacterized protein YbjQ (UPF0145 family)
MFDLKGGLCSACRTASAAEASERKKRTATAATQGDVQKVWLTTETTIANMDFERLGILTAECAFGMNAFKDLFAGVRDVVGGRSDAVQKTLKDSREVVFQELRIQAFELGADAIIAVDLDYVELSTAGSMLLLVGSGTAVKFQ